MRIAGVLLGGGASSRFGSNKLEAAMDGRRLVDIACAHFLEAGLDPVVFAGRLQPEDPRVRVVAPGGEMIETLRHGLRALPDVPFCFAPADMPALRPELIRDLIGAWERSGKPFLIPCYRGRRGHPAFARVRGPFMLFGEEEGAREVWRTMGEDIENFEVETGDVLFDVDTPDDLAAAGTEALRLERLVARGSIG